MVLNYSRATCTQKNDVHCSIITNVTSLRQQWLQTGTEVGTKKTPDVRSTIESLQQHQTVSKNSQYGSKEKQG